MVEGAAAFFFALRLRQIARIVADAKAKNSIIHASHHAIRLFAEFPQANLTVARIVDEIVHSASHAGVAVE